jgi:hypothetical protein
MFKRISILAPLLFTAFPIHADEAAFYGEWKITGAAKAPWEDPDHPMITDDAERYTGTVVGISKGEMTGPDLLGCGTTILTVEALPYAGLFEGGLAANPKNAADPYDIDKAKRLAEGLGFTAEPVESLFHGCSEIILHRMNGQTLLFGLNNRIFTLARQ